MVTAGVKRGFLAGGALRRLATLDPLEVVLPQIKLIEAERDMLLAETAAADPKLAHGLDPRAGRPALRKRMITARRGRDMTCLIVSVAAGLARSRRVVRGRRRGGRVAKQGQGAALDPPRAQPLEPRLFDEDLNGRLTGNLI